MRKLLIAASLTLIVTACATKKYVGAEIDAAETRTQQQVAEIKKMVEETQTEIRDLAKELNVQIEGLESNTQDLTRKTNENAESISKLGHITFKKTMSDAQATFKSDSSELSDAAKADLDNFAELLKKQNRLVHIEIQGHTDNRGSESYNLKLGEERARSVHDYLYQQHDFPLHLMNVISLGSTDPVTDNKTREARAANRRVVIVVRIQI